jgi:hypothetical protein
LPLISDDDKRIYIHVPMSADKSSYFGLPDSEDRAIPVLLIGALNKDVYPLRVKISRYITSGTIAGTQLEHWGHRIKQIGENWHNTQREEYSKALRSAKITIITSSLYDYQLQKYAEALLSGTLLMGSVPQDNAQLWKQCVIPLSLHDTSEQVNREINYWLTHDAARISHVRKCQAAGLKYSTWENTIVRLTYQSYHRHVRHNYGVVFPFGSNYRLPRTASCNFKERANANEPCPTQWDGMREAVDNFDNFEELWGLEFHLSKKVQAIEYI